jgi:hypothetical protein
MSSLIMGKLCWARGTHLFNSIADKPHRPFHIKWPSADFPLDEPLKLIIIMSRPPVFWVTLPESVCLAELPLIA